MREPKKITNGGMIQNAMGQQVAVTEPKKEKLKDMIQNADVQEMFRNSLHDQAPSFLASLVELVSQSKELQACDPKDLILTGFAAANLHLPINRALGYAYILAFNVKGRFQPSLIVGYKGWVQLALRSNSYKTINSSAVRAGQLKSIDPLTGSIDLSGAPTSEAIVGYVAYLETTGGFSVALFKTIEEIRAHAKRFSKGYTSGNSPWQSDFSAMAEKTVLKQLISKFGIMSIEMQNAIIAEYGSAEDDKLPSNLVTNETFESAPTELLNDKQDFSDVA